MKKKVERFVKYIESLRKEIKYIKNKIEKLVKRHLKLKLQWMDSRTERTEERIFDTPV